MTLQEMINYEKRDSLEVGQIIGAILNCKYLGLDINQTKEAIINQFQLYESVADKYLNLYWNPDTSK